MLHRLLLAALLTASLTVISGCVDFEQADGCTSDDDCRYGRICSAELGKCVDPGISSGPVDQPDGEDEPDADPNAPDSVDLPDIGYDAEPEPDGDWWVADAEPIPDAEPDAEPDIGPEPEPDVGHCQVVADARAKLQNTTRWRERLDQVNPLETVVLDASPSQNADSYEWTVLERPQGSTQRLLPGDQSEIVRLFLDLVGTYRVELRAYGHLANGERCVDSDIVEIVVCPCNAELHVQLVWNTPSDSDQTDEIGADLDLHYLHPNGRWNELPWDIFWRNNSADWGVQGDSSDDPSLDIDDTDGAGPENVSHSGMESGTYGVGAYYYAEAGLGASYATIRIYYDGQLIYEHENRFLLRSGMFWHAADVSFPSGSATRVDDITEGFPLQ